MCVCVHRCQAIHVEMLLFIEATTISPFRWHGEGLILFGESIISMNSEELMDIVSTTPNASGFVGDMCPNCGEPSIQVLEDRTARVCPCIRHKHRIAHYADRGVPARYLETTWQEEVDPCKYDMALLEARLGRLIDLFLLSLPHLLHGKKISVNLANGITRKIPNLNICGGDYALRSAMLSHL